MILTFLTLAFAADPWHRPAHLRAVAAPPADWSDLLEARQPVRLWWDEGRHPAQIEALIKGSWRTVAEEARPGWVSEPLPRGTAFRVRLSAGPEARFSEPVTAPAWVSPAELAQLSARPGDVLAGMVGVVDFDAQTSTLWATTLGGGALTIDRDGLTLRRLTRWEGLPDDLCLAVDAEGGRALIGTAHGAALVEEGRVVRIFDEGLADPYVQSVLLDGPRLWLGTYRGLDRVDLDDPVAVLRPWSVFSLSHAQGGGLWVGYEGLRPLPVDATWTASPEEPAEEAPLPGPALLDEGHVYGVLAEPGATWLASTDAGLLRSVGGEPPLPVQGYPSDEVYDVERSEAGVWVAAGGLGVVGPDGALWGAGQGLPGSAAWSLASTPAGDLYVGTNAGLARLFPGAQSADPRKQARRSVVSWPAAPWPAATPLHDLLLGRAGAFLAGPEGVRIIGAPHKAAGDLVVGAGPRVAALAEAEDGVWAFGERAVRLDRKGRLHQVALPGRAVDGAAAAGTVWVGTEDGLYRYEAGADRFVPTTDLVELTRLAPGPLGLWVIARRAIFEVVAGGARPFLRTRPALDLAPVDGAVWVGTEDGLERLIVRGERSGEVEDVLGRGDAGVAVPAVASDGADGCWFAAADGTVGRVSATGARGASRLPGAEPPRPTRIVPFGADQAWVLTEAGTWLVQVRLGDQPAPTHEGGFEASP